MTEPMKLAWAAAAMGAEATTESPRDIVSVCTDTREGAAGSLFFALQGERVDGHQLVATAFQQGAVAAVVSRHDERYAGPVVLVRNTTDALGLLAGAYRDLFPVPVVGVTGSIGKTTVKELLGAVFGAVMPTLVSEHNFNTEIGVPKTLFRLSRAHRAAVVEMGMRGPGQIAWLAEIARPQIGVVTRIGRAHQELLGSRTAIAEAKAELLSGLPTDGTAILPADDDFVDLLKSRTTAGAQILTFGQDGRADRPDVGYTLLGEGVGFPRARFRVCDRSFEVLFGAFGGGLLHNAAAAIAVATQFAIDTETVARALSEWRGAPGRMTIRTALSGAAVIDDCYNAAPESVVEALGMLRRISKPRRVAVIGEMRELGDAAGEAYGEVAEAARSAGLRLLVTVGADAKAVAEGLKRLYADDGRCAPETLHFTCSEDAANVLPQRMDADDVVLVKGSRALEMEKIVYALTREQDTYGHG